MHESEGVKGESLAKEDFAGLVHHRGRRSRRVKGKCGFISAERLQLSAAA